MITSTPAKTINIANNPTMAERLWVIQMMVKMPMTQAAANTGHRPPNRRPANTMTGIKLKPTAVQRIYKKGGRGGVRDHLIELLIREDLADPKRRVTPDSKPDTSVFEVQK